MKNYKYINYCTVAVFGPDPLQWICRKWVQKLGSDEATACFGDEKHTESDGPTSQGEGFPRPRTGIPNFSRILRASFLSLGLLLLGRPPVLGDPCCYIFLSSVHPPPTLVSHPCLFSSARPISGTLWAAAAPTALSRGHIHINGIRVLAASI